MGVHDPLRRQRQPDVLVGPSLPVTAMFQERTGSIPIGFLALPDPVRNGFVANRARPDRNLIGLIDFEFSMGAKWLEALGQIAPNVPHLGLMLDRAAIPHGGRYNSFTRLVICANGAVA